MEKSYSEEDLESLVKGFIKVSKILQTQKPDCLLAPITGAVPFIDILTIIDRKFDFNSVQYVPSTSKFDNLLELMEEWYTSFLKVRYTGEKIRLVTLDEVISGASAVRAFDAYKKALNNLAKRTTQELGGKAQDYESVRKTLNKNISYLSVGIVEKDRNRSRANRRYQDLVKKGNIIEVPVKRIITMDYPPLCPLNLKLSHKSNDQKRAFYKPEIESFEVSPEYIQLLQDIARYVGVDPSTVSPVNVSRIANFRNFIPERLL